MKPWRTVNLRVWLPVVVFVLFTALSGVIVLYQYQGQKHALEQAGLNFARQEMLRLQVLIEHAPPESTMRDAEILISQLGVLSEVKTLIAVDAAGRVILSLRDAWKEKPAADVAAGFDAGLFEQVQSSHQTSVMLINPVGNANRAIAAYFPLRLPPQAGESRSSRVGCLFLLYDLTASYQRLLFNVLRDGGFLWLANFLVMLVLLIALQVLVSRPVRRLQEAARQLACGDYSARLHYMGKGEFAQLAETFNLMVQRLEQGHDFLVKQKNLYSLLNAANEMILRFSDPEALFRELCRIAVCYQGISLAWAGHVFDEGRSVRIRASAGVGRDHLHNKNFRLLQDRNMEDPLEQVIRNGSHLVINDIFAVAASEIGHETARATGIRSAALFPIIQSGHITGIFTLYADTASFFTPDIVGLLNKMAEDIAYALDTIENDRKRRKAEQMLSGQRDLLQSISEGSPLSSVLADLCANVESLLGQEACSSVLLVQKGRLLVGAAPNLPDGYLRAAKGLAIGPSGGICGRVAASGEEVYSADLRSQPGCSVCRSYMHSCGLRACWSIPIKSSQNGILGVFTIYYPGPRQPDVSRREVVDRFVYLAGIAIERRQAEEVLREREENLSITLNSIGDAVIATDRAGVIERMNPVAEKLTGWIFREAVGRPLAEVFRIVHAHGAQAVESPVERVLRDGCVVGLANDTTLITRDGRRRQIADCAAPIRDKHEDIIGVILVFHDVTEEYLMQANLRQSEMLLKHHIENTPLAAIVWDPQCRVVQWNNAAERIFGYPAGEAIGRHSLQLIMPPGSQEVLLNEGVQAFLSQSGQSRVIENLTREGRTICCEWYHTPLRDEAGAVVGVASLAQDVTERRLMDEVMHGVAREAGGLVAEAFFQTLVRQLSSGLQTDFAFVGLLCDNATHVETIAMQWHGQPGASVCYPLADSPCERVVLEGFCLEMTGVTARFPRDPTLVQMGVDSYAGVSLCAANGKTVGLLGVMHSKPINYPDTILSLLNIFAIRCSAELQRMQAEEELRLAAIAFETHEAILITDRDGKIIRVNKAFSEITGYSSEEVIGRSPNLLASGMHSEDFFVTFWNELRTHGQWQGEIWNRRKNGEIFPQIQSVTAVKDESGGVSRYVCAFLDISEQKKAEVEIQRLAYYDILTNLPNRRMLMERLQQELSSANRHQNNGALLFLDLDHFKTINDALGHSVGDMLLKQVSDRLVGTVRAEDTVARLGGDEFVVLLPGLDGSADAAAKIALAVAEKIRSVIGAAYDLLGSEHHTSTSIGITLFPQESNDPEELLKQADTAMYRAKAAGRNEIRYYLPDMQVAADARLALEKDLRHALVYKEFCLYYQPQFNSRRELIGAEILLRWQHPKRGMVSPAEFIPVAEDTGLVVAIGEWVLLQACHQFKQWMDEGVVGPRMDIAVNVSPRQFHRAEFVDQVLGILEKTGMEPGRLVLELTEGIVIENIGETIEKMRVLKAHGIHFSIDDFGTGYSSLAYLKRLPIDQLKIDRSFVQDMCGDASDRVIVETIIAMAQHMGLDVIAEGVETEQQLRFLEQNGCGAYQGYHFSRPISEEAFGRYLGAVGVSGQTER